MREQDALLKRARDTLAAAGTLAESGYFADSLSRAYYAAFYAAQALLLAEGVTPKSHSGTHALLDKHFGKAERLPRPTTRLLRRLYDVRQMADYSSDPAATEEAAERALRDAARFVAGVEEVLNRQ